MRVVLIGEIEMGARSLSNGKVGMKLAGMEISLSPAIARGLAEALMQAASETDPQSHASGEAAAADGKTVKGESADVLAFRARFAQDNAESMTDEQWEKWINSLTQPEMLGMIEIGCASPKEKAA